LYKGGEMTWLILVFALEAGIIPNGGFMMYERQPQVFYYQGEYYYPISVTQETIAPMFYTDLSVEIQIIEIFYIGGGVRVPMKFDGAGFDPKATYYDFQFGARYGQFDIFWHHACRHPQMTYMYDYLTTTGWEGGYDEIGFKITGKWNGSKGTVGERLPK